MFYSHQLSLAQGSTLVSGGIAMLILHRYIRCRIGQFPDTEGVLPHLLGMTGIGAGNGNHSVLSYLCWTCDVLARPHALQRTIGHRGLNLIQRHTWHTDADGVGITCIKHVHQVGRYSSAGLNYGVVLCKLTAYAVAIAIHHLHIALQRKVASLATHGFVQSVLKVYLLSADKDIGYLGGINSSHHDTGRETVATNNRF